MPGHTLHLLRTAEVTGKESKGSLLNCASVPRTSPCPVSCHVAGEVSGAVGKGAWAPGSSHRDPGRRRGSMHLGDKQKQLDS